MSNLTNSKFKLPVNGVLVIKTLVVLLALGAMVFAYFQYEEYQEEKKQQEVYKGKNTLSSIQKVSSCKVLWDKMKDSWIEETGYKVSTEVFRDSAISEIVGGKGAGGGGEDAGVTGTNNQVEGVDEGDLVKYYNNNLFTISNFYSNTGESVKKLSVSTVAPDTGKITLHGQIVFGQDVVSVRHLNVYDNKLVVLADVSDRYNLPAVSPSMRMEDFYYDQLYTKVLVYDTQNLKDLKLVKDFRVDGSVKQTRTIGEDLYFITEYNNYEVYPLLKNTFDDAAKVNSILSKYMPYIGETEKYSVQDDCANINVVYPIKNTSFTNVVGINLKDYKINSTSILGAGEVVYVSPENLYLTSHNYLSYKNRTETTDIFKFNLKDGKVAFDVAGAVDGKILNQFSLDEYEGNLRVATDFLKVEKDDIATWNPSPEINDDTVSSMPINPVSRMDNRTTGVYIFNSKLEKVSSFTGLAKGERIYSVRFMGKKGYVVTFKEVDPLFVFDLSDIENIKLLGELKIPGYSSYLHPISENQLIGVGYDVEIREEGTISQSVVNKGVKVSLFDVSDPTQPKELSGLSFGDVGSYTHVAYDHRAFAFSNKAQIAGVPVAEHVLNTNYGWNYGELEKLGSYFIRVQNNSLSVDGFISHTTNLIDQNNRHSEEVRNAEIFRQYFAGRFIITVSNGFIQINTTQDYKFVDKVKI